MPADMPAAASTDNMCSQAPQDLESQSSLLP